jgi:hypothetical protein
MAIMVLACSITLPASASTTYKVNGKTRVYYGTKSKVYYDGQKISSSKKYGIYINDNFMIPYKNMLVNKGPRMSSSYNKITKTLILSYKNTQIRMIVGSKKVFVNGARKSNLNTPPMSVKMEGKRIVVVPAKRVCAELGLGYSYNSSTRQLYITGAEEQPAPSTPVSNTMVNTVNSAIKASSLKNLTTEEYGGRKVKIKAAFRKYNSISESIADHSAYLVNAMNGSKRRYYGLTATKKYNEQLKILQKGGYCTWGSYVSELTNLIKKYKLTKFDN